MHAEGGSALRKELHALRCKLRAGGPGIAEGLVDFVAVAPGEAIRSSAPGRLYYDGLVHAVGPLGDSGGASETLRCCHRAALASIAQEVGESSAVAARTVVAAIPLMGSGVGGLSAFKAASAATDAVVEQMDHPESLMLLRFVAHGGEDAKIWRTVLENTSALVPIPCER